MDSASSGTSATTSAIGNAATATGQNAALDNESSQALGGDVAARGQTSVGGDSGPYYVSSSSATGNTGDAATCCAALTGTMSQSVGANTVSAQNYAYLVFYTESS